MQSESVICENPKCHRHIEKNTAHSFVDKDWFEHFACPNQICLIDAMIAYQERQTVIDTFEAVMAL